MILLFFIGAVFVYALAFMALLVGLLAVGLSLCIYAATYVVGYCVAKIKHRVGPEWKFDKRPWTPDLDLLQGIAVGAGVFSLASMVVMLIAYTVSEDMGTAIGITVFFLVIAGMFGLVEWNEERNRREQESGKVDEINRPWCSGPKS